MIKTVLLFFLGFFAAGCVALLLAPLVWRRAVRLTTRRMEASLPLSTNELEAEKDRLRADHAMATRRLEMRVEKLNRRTSSQMIELSRVTDEAQQLAVERDRLDTAINRLETQNAEQRETLERSAAEIDDLKTRLEDALETLGERTAALNEFEDKFEEERLRSSSRQIDLASRDTELQRLEVELAAARRDRKEAIRAVREADNARKEALAGLKVAEKRNSDLQKKLESQMRLLYEHEEKLRRKESELDRLRDRSDIGKEGEMNVVSAQLQEGEREKLQSRISRLMQENKRLRSGASRQKPPRGDATGTAQTDDVLREEIQSLAAEVVSLAATLEGGESRINTLLGPESEQTGEGRPLSLAERIRGLREQAAR